MRVRLLAAALAIAALAPSVATADDASEAALHFELGSELYGRRQYTEALEHFLAANRLVPNPSYAFNIAQTYELLRRPRDAFNWYETFVRSPGLPDDDVEDGRRRQARLVPRVAVVDVASTPEGATVYVDRVELGSLGAAPRAVAVEPGERTVHVRLDGYHAASTTVTAAVGARVEAAITLRPLVGRVRIESTPPGADVRLADAPDSLGVTPVEVELPLGEHLLAVSLDGYVRERRVVTIRADETTALAMPLARAAATVSTLTVECAPEGAEVLLDGEALGAAPLTRGGLPPGSAQLVLRAPGYDPWTRRVALEAGAATHVTARLRDPGAAPWEGIAWIGYVGGAVLAAAAIALGAAALAQRDALFGARYHNPEDGAPGTVSDLALAADVLGGGAIVLLGATLVWDLATGPGEPSSGEVEVQR